MCVCVYSFENIQNDQRWKLKKKQEKFKHVISLQRENQIYNMFSNWS